VSQKSTPLSLPVAVVAAAVKEATDGPVVAEAPEACALCRTRL
jgi:hypothetical protein